MDKATQILVTGGCGFIGTHLCRALIERGYSVRVLDIVPPRSLVEGVEYRLGDVCDRAAVESAVKGVGAVFHFAAIASVPVCESDPVRSYRTNLMGTAQVLEVFPKGLLVFSSSCAVYGKQGDHGRALREDDATVLPLSSYGIQKLASERLIRNFCLAQGLRAVVFRFFNVYGEGQDPSSPYSGVISVFGSRLDRGEPLRLYGEGDQTRDFVSVHDVVLACLLSLELGTSACDGLPINLASGRKITIRELANIMMQSRGRKVGLETAAARPEDIRHSLGNTERAHEVLGWSPQIALEDGLKRLHMSGRVKAE